MEERPDAPSTPSSDVRFDLCAFLEVVRMEKTETPAPPVMGPGAKIL
jgi:hypothetical protein